MHAAASGHLECCELLYHTSADFALEARSDWDETALDLARAAHDAAAALRLHAEGDRERAVALDRIVSRTSEVLDFLWDPSKSLGVATSEPSAATEERVADDRSLSKRSSSAEDRSFSRRSDKGSFSKGGAQKSFIAKVRSMFHSTSDAPSRSTTEKQRAIGSKCASGAKAQLALSAVEPKAGPHQLSRSSTFGAGQMWHSMKTALDTDEVESDAAAVPESRTERAMGREADSFIQRVVGLRRRVLALFKPQLEPAVPKGSRSVLQEAQLKPQIV